MFLLWHDRDMRHEIAAILRLVEHHGGPTATARKLGDAFPYQEVQRWVSRGWASPMHVLKLMTLAHELGITESQLLADRDMAKAETGG